MHLPTFVRSIAHLGARLVTELRGPELRHSTITLTGSLGRFALGFVTSVMLARLLGPSGYGLIALVSLVLSIVDTLGDFGLTMSAVRAISRALGPEPEHARRLAGAFFSLGLIANSLAALGGILLAGPIARVILERPEAELYLRLAMIGLFSVAFNGFVTAVLQSLGRFGRLAAVQVLSAVTYLIGIVGLAVLDRLDIATVVLLGALNPLVGFVVGLRFLPPGFFSITEAFTRPARRGWRELMSFGKWLWISSILSLLASQLDLLLLGRWASPVVVGIYALAFNLAMKMDILNQAHLTVVLPSVSALRTPGEMRTFIFRSLTRSTMLAVGLALAIPFVRPFISTFYGTEYVGAVPVLFVLVVVVLFDLVTSPLILLGFPLDLPRALAASDAVRVITLLVAGWFLIPAFGAAGAALTRLASRVCGALFIFALIALRLRQARKEPLGSPISSP